MANSRYEYVKNFEQDDRALPETYLMVRVDGRGFTKFSAQHEWQKPHEDAALHLMNTVAEQIMHEYGDIICAIGASDEYSFVFCKETTLFGRRISKITTSIVSSFTGKYVFMWPQFFPQRALRCPPSFDGRLVSYPSDQSIKDYLSWRQVDFHINNQYNYCFWTLVQQGGITNTAAQQKLKGTTTEEKNELLFSTYGVNYNELPQIHRKGTVLVRTVEDLDDGSVPNSSGHTDGTWSGDGDNDKGNDDNNSCGEQKSQHPHLDKSQLFSVHGARYAPVSKRSVIKVLHEDIIRADFWTRNVGVIPYVSLQKQLKLIKLQNKAEEKKKAKAKGGEEDPEK